MIHQQTLAEFYPDKLQLRLPDSLRSGGHFAVFRPEDFAADPALAAAYGRKDFYKNNAGRYHVAPGVVFNPAYPKLRVQLLAIALVKRHLPGFDESHFPRPVLRALRGGGRHQPAGAAAAGWRAAGRALQPV